MSRVPVGHHVTSPVLHVIGTRPNFPKAAPVLRALDDLGVPQLLVHTGQHYSDELSAIFFRQLDLPAPDFNLGVGSGTHAQQTAAVMVALEKVLTTSVRPSMVVVYGDVNSTLAAALVASKLGIPVAHVEAGLRSHDRSMPEELNRIVIDQLSDLLFATSPDAVAHLAASGIPADRIHFVGNPMIDTLLACRSRFVRPAFSGYVAATLHRPANVDAPTLSLVKALHAVADQIDLVLPLHPRGRPSLQAAGLFDHPRVRVLDPMGYLEFLGLLEGASAVVTDSGGVQEETTVLGVPCFTLRPNTERPVTITHGTNRLTTPESLPEDVAAALSAPRPSARPIPPLWDGHAGPRIGQIIAKEECS
jgi:UDP-N-acetylglucosamine 2-epimerase (non-hydrolysing)